MQKFSVVILETVGPYFIEPFTIVDAPVSEVLSLKELQYHKNLACSKSRLADSFCFEAVSHGRFGEVSFPGYADHRTKVTFSESFT